MEMERIVNSHDKFEIRTWHVIHLKNSEFEMEHFLWKSFFTNFNDT